MSGKPQPQLSVQSEDSALLTLLYYTTPPLTLVALTDEFIDIGRILVLSYCFQCSFLSSHFQS